MDNELRAAMGRVQANLAEFTKAARDDIKLLTKRLDEFEVRAERPTPGGFGSYSGGGLEGVMTAIKENPGFQQLQASGHGRAVIEVKNLVPFLETKQLVSGSLVPYQHEPGIAAGGRPVYGLVRRLMRAIPIQTGIAHFVRETAFTDAASPQVEASAKSESSFALTADTEKVETLAHWTQASKQILEDLPGLEEHIRTSLVYGLERETEEQILYGSGVSPNLNGLVTLGTPFDPTLLNGLATFGYEWPDTLRAAVLQLALAGYACSGFVINPTDWFLVETLRDSTGRYLIGDPRRTLDDILWSRPIVATPAMVAGTFLAGDFDSGCHLRVRQESTIDMSDSHADFFVKNLIAIRGETRLTLVTPKPRAFIQGSLARSPA